MKRFLFVIVLLLLIFMVAETYNSLPESPDMPAVPSAPAAPEISEDSPEPEQTAEPTPETSTEPEETPEPSPSQTPPPTQPPVPTQSPELKGDYYIAVNVEANTITVYTRDENGDFSVPYKAIVCSTGSATPTSGVYTLGVQHRWHYLFGDVYGQYTTQITGNILFHSVPYTIYGDPSSLEYWEFDKLGTNCSMGCVRMQVKDAKWIYDNASLVAAVEFYNSPDPGPLGKPSAPIISDNEDCRGWDPTDPDPKNPWLNPPAESTPKPGEPVSPPPSDPGKDDNDDVIIIDGEPSPEPAPPDDIIIIG